MIDAHALQGVRRAIRRYLDLAADDNVDLVLLAAILANCDPSREVPLWLTILAGDTESAGEILDLFRPWRGVLRLPDDLGLNYFLAIRDPQTSALHRARKQGRRVMIARELGSFACSTSDLRGQLAHQMRGIHDGILVRASPGPFDAAVYGVLHEPDDPLVDEPTVTPLPPAERLGFVTACDPGDWFDWRGSYPRMSSRVLAYHWTPTFKRDDVDEPTRASRSRFRDGAADSVSAFLAMAVENVSSIAPVHVPKPARDWLKFYASIFQSAAVPGVARTFERLEHFARVLAAIQGRDRVGSIELEICRGLAMSQVSPDAARVLCFLTFMNSDGAGRSFRASELEQATRVSTSSLRRILERLTAADVLCSATNARGPQVTRYALAPRYAAKLASLLALE